MMPRLETAVNAIGRCTRLQQGCIKLVNHNVAADVSRLKLSNLAPLIERSAEKNDPAHAGCYHSVAADVSRLKLSNPRSFSHARRRIMIRLTPDATKKGELDAALRLKPCQ
jgi:hypothetical protein